jgi:hypothetical protein
MTTNNNISGMTKHIVAKRMPSKRGYVLIVVTSNKMADPIIISSRKILYATLKSIERNMRKRNISGTIKCLIAGVQSVRRIRDSITTYEREFMPDSSVCPVIDRRPKKNDYPRYTPDEMQVIDNPHLDRVEYHYYDFLHRMRVDIRNEPERAEDARRLAEHFASLEKERWCV